MLTFQHLKKKQSTTIFVSIFTKIFTICTKKETHYYSQKMLMVVDSVVALLASNQWMVGSTT